MNKYFSTLLLSASLALPALGAGDWVTTFEDNFNGTSLNRSNWYVIKGTEADFNGEQQWYVDEEGVENNFWVSDGSLKIKIQKETRTFGGKTKYYTSGRLSTKNKIEKSQGLWQARICFWKSDPANGYLAGLLAFRAPDQRAALYPCGRDRLLADKLGIGNRHLGVDHQRRHHSLEPVHHQCDYRDGVSVRGLRPV